MLSCKIMRVVQLLNSKKEKFVKKKATIVGILLIISFCYSFIFTHNMEIYTTGDISFHLSRIKGLATIFSGPINYSTFNYNGSGVNLFYPFLTIIPATFFYWLTGNLILSYFLFIWVLNTVTILVAFVYSKKFFNRSDIAFVFSCLFTFSAYRTVDIYYRSALAESIALTILIPVIYYSYSTLFKNERNFVGLSISISLLVYTHVVSVVLYAIFLLLLFIIRLLFLKKNPMSNLLYSIITFFKAGLITLFLTSFFWVVFLQQYMYQKISPPINGDMFSKALSLKESFMGALRNDLTTYIIGIVGLIGIFIPIFLVNKMNTKEKIIYGLSVFTWIFTSTFFPWKKLSVFPFNILQFPWRILGIQGILGSVILSIVYKYIANKKKNNFIIVSILVFLLVIGIFSQRMYIREIGQGENKVKIVINNQTLEEYTTHGMRYFLLDYTPQEAVQSYSENILNHEVQIENEWLLSNFSVTNGSSITYNIDLTSNELVTLPVYSYLGTNVRLNNHNVSHRNNKGLVALEVPEGNNYITISSTYSKKAMISIVISCTSLILLIFYYFKNKQFPKDISAQSNIKLKTKE